jgi:PTS system nitrogen regulatory IIA component
MAIINEGLAELIKRGGVYSGLRGTNLREVLEAFIGALPSIPSVPADKLLTAVLEREALMSTGIGGGIALPHPRNPLAGTESEQFVALALLEAPVNWNSLDGEKVDTLLLIVSSSAKQHLQTLSEITFFCRQKDFCRLLKERAPLEELLCFIREAEKNWK